MKLRRLAQSEVTPAITAVAKSVRDRIRPENLAIGFEHAFEAGGRKFVAKIEWHEHPEGGPIKPWGKHKGVSIFAVQAQEERPAMQSIKKGSKNPDVGRWQLFLRGVDLYFGVIDDDFGPKTHDATVRFQALHGLKQDGVVGNKTYAVAMREGYALIDDEPFPPPPRFASLGASGRNKVYGKFAYLPAPTETNPEAIKITDDWARENIVVVGVPQLQRISGAPETGRVSCHRLVAPKLLELFAAWEAAGLMKHVIRWDGLYVPRFVRGSRTTLSSHSHGSAFDINAKWNGLGQVPAARGDTGSVRELVPIANRLGWYWGGHFSRPDGMHFELIETDMADTERPPEMPEDPN